MGVLFENSIVCQVSLCHVCFLVGCCGLVVCCCFGGGWLGCGAWLVFWFCLLVFSCLFLVGFFWWVGLGESFFFLLFGVLAPVFLGVGVLLFCLESLILAQDERWRRA